MGDVTLMLNRVKQGDPSAGQQLFELVYLSSELRGYKMVP